MNVPNLLTFLRIALVPLFVILLIYGYTFHAFLTLLFAGLTDAMDGLIARIFNQKTILGAYLDPIADKLLLTTSYIVLAVVDVIPPWLTVLVISRDILIITGFAVLFILGMSPESRPTILGKASTFMQTLTVIIALSVAQPLTMLQPLLSPSIYLSALLTILSGIHYTYIGIRRMGEVSA